MSIRSFVKHTLAAAMILVPSLAVADGSWGSALTVVSPKAGAVVEVKGNLSSGATMDLAWAANSSVACFPATQFDNFKGKHVLYGTAIPKDSILTITAVPENGETDVNVYAYMMGATDFTHTPPNVPSAVSCEASYPTSGKNPGTSEKVVLNATTHPYNVVIGVAGAKGVSSGGYTLKLELKSKSAASTATLTAVALTAPASGTVTKSGKLDDGAKIDLAFAANSSVACFPATENVNFNGNHVVYRTSIAAQSTMTVTATPSDPKLDISVYAYMVAAGDTTTVPPNVPSAVSCEAGYDQKNDHNPGVAETAKLTATTHSYTVYIGVAGAGAATSGAYDLKVETKPR